MGVATKIQWSHHSWSPWHGCQRVSPGCEHCYAEAGSVRNPGVLGVWGPQGTRVISKSWDKPLAWDRAARKAGERRRVFPSLCDPFEDREELVNPRIKFFDLIRRTPDLDWLLLTKRPEHAKQWLEGSRVQGLWPLPNVWLGVSVEDQKRADERIPVLLEIPAAVRYLSLEPLLGPVDVAPYLEGAWCADADPDSPGRECPGIDWCIVGGESGRAARPCDVAWIRSIRDQCKAADVPVFVKQLGANAIDSGRPRSWANVTGPESHYQGIPTGDPKGGDPDEWPEDLRVREIPGGR